MITLTLILAMAATMPAAAMDEVGGADPGLFGKPTSVEPETIIGGGIDESSNVNRSKDSAVIPPPFGSPSSNTPGTGESLTPYISGMPVDPGISYGAPMVTGDGNTSYHPSSPAAPNGPDQIQVSYTDNFTLPDGLFYEDGSIGALSIPKLNLSVKVYEDESLENLKKGVGHFKSTSSWNGNVGFAGHNRGLADHFGSIHTLKNGDRIIYTTKLGTRTYEVYFVGQIHETDFSRLGRTENNIVTLITCAANRPELRVCVQAREV